jgi:hypothetical protein
VSEKPVYLETWVPHYQWNLRVADDHGYTADMPEVFIPSPHAERQRLAAAAPSLVRALLIAEWGYVNWDDGSCGPQCQGCSIELPNFDGKHDALCTVDSALTAAGFPDQASRDEARRRISEMKP